MAFKNQEPSQLHDAVGVRVAIVDVDSTAYKNLLVLAAGDSQQETHLFSITVSSNDTVSRDLRFAISDGANDIEQGDIAIAANSGFSISTPPVQAIANRTSPVLSRVLKDIRGNWFLVLRPGETLKVKATTAVTAAKTISINAFGWKFTRSL